MTVTVDRGTLMCEEHDIPLIGYAFCTKCELELDMQSTYILKAGYSYETPCISADARLDRLKTEGIQIVLDAQRAVRRSSGPGL